LTKKTPYKGLGADSEEKHEPASDVDTVVVDSLKALDPKRPIREADIGVIVVRQLFDPARLSSGRRLKVMLSILAEIDDHLSVRRLLLFNDGIPEACRSLRSLLPGHSCPFRVLAV
jgi:hypothetical protein